ncbi:hypothetical protein LTR84_006835 [Exophiala bonariae]|uniref:Uncharacterized protein n=1 Tax=Exophiala bonariae TaxID=1690606 RepID=A0AAV9N026_9EURO|nr:hypothetical protein LTR84_006835 [Exophiala bonariae]
MSGALATNYFLEGYATQHRDAMRARAAAEGRTLSVENPESKRIQQQKSSLSSSQSQSQPSTTTTQHEQQQNNKTSWWSSKFNKGSSKSSSAKEQQQEADAKSLHSFSSGSSY